jgi:hypothetical protein
MLHRLLLTLALSCGQPRPPEPPAQESDHPAAAHNALATNNPVLAASLSPTVVATLDDEQLVLVEQFSQEHYLELLSAARHYDAAATALLEELASPDLTEPPDPELTAALAKAHDDYQLTVIDGVLGLLRITGPEGRAAFNASGRSVYHSACNAVLQYLYEPHMEPLEALEDVPGLARETGYGELLLRDVSRSRSLTETLAGVVEACGRIDPDGEAFEKELDGQLFRAIVATRSSMDERLALALQVYSSTPADSRLALVTTTSFTDYAGLTIQGSPLSTSLLTQRPGSSPPSGGPQPTQLQTGRPGVVPGGAPPPPPPGNAHPG